MYIVILLNLFSHEKREVVSGRILKSIHSEYSERVRYTIIDKPAQLKSVGSGTVIVTDQLYRFGNNPDQVLKMILQQLHKGCEIWIPETLDYRKSKEEKFKQDLELLEVLSNIKRDVKSARIKQSLFVKRQLKGTIHETSKLTSEMKQKVISLFQKIGGVRAVAKELGISPASVSRIIKEAKRE